MNQPPRVSSRHKAPPPTNTWGMVAVGASKIPVRWIVMWVGLAGWLATTFIYAGGPNGITAFSFNLSLILALLLVCSFTRSVPLRTVSLMFFSGGVMLGVVLLCEHIYDINWLVGVRSLGVPLLEETLAILPMPIYFWFCRRLSLWTFGVSDCLLMGAALGAGFAFVHDAFRHNLDGWHHSVQWLPTADLLNETYLVSGHAVWSAIAGAGIGLAFMYMHNRKIGLVASLAGLFWVLIDHMGASNFNSQHQIAAQLFQFLTGRGFLTPYIFAGSVGGAILLDTWIKLKWCPKAEEFRLPKRSDTATSGLTGLWDFMLDRRRLCYANFRRMHLAHPNADMAVAVIAQSLINKHSPERMSQLFETMTRQAGETTFLSTSLAEELFESPLVQNAAIDLPEQYQLISRMSVGGMGAIYKGRHRKTNALLAVKILHAHVADLEVNRQRFDREAKAASALKHPNLVVIHDYGITHERQIPYLVMELIEGNTLQDEFGKHGGLPPNRFFHIFDQVCAALSHAHSRGVIHRDIKPSNILLMDSKEIPDFVKVVDFGIAKVIDPKGAAGQELTQTGDLLGSPLYMSPEQCLGENLDERTDIYSLGCVMYQAITGSPPIIGENVVKTIFKHISVVPEPFAVAKPDLNIPPAVERVIFKAMEKKADNRYRTMDQLRSELSSARQAIYLVGT